MKSSNTKELQAKAFLKKHPEFLTTLMQHLSVRGNSGEEIANIKSNSAINAQFRALATTKDLLDKSSLSTFAGNILTHLDIGMDIYPMRSGSITSTDINIVFKRPALLIALAAELKIPLAGVLEEQRDALAPAAGSGRGSFRR